MNFKRCSFLIVTAVAICLKLAPVPQSASQSSEDLIVTTKRQVTVAGRILKYTARAGRLPILDNETGEVHGASSSPRIPSTPRRINHRDR